MPMKAVRDSIAAKALGLKGQRFTYECACIRGTDDYKEFEDHVVGCPAVFPAVRHTLAQKIANGERIAIAPRPSPGDRDGQESFAGFLSPNFESLPMK